MSEEQMKSLSIFAESHNGDSTNMLRTFAKFLYLHTKFFDNESEWEQSLLDVFHEEHRQQKIQTINNKIAELEEQKANIEQRKQSSEAAVNNRKEIDRKKRTSHAKNSSAKNHPVIATASKSIKPRPHPKVITSVKVGPQPKRRPPVAFIIWLKEHREQIMLENPGLTTAEISQRGAEVWKSLADKQKWYKASSKANQAYLKANAFEGKIKSKDKTSKVE